MSDEKQANDKHQQNSDKIPERRHMLRYPSNAGAQIFRELDVMRVGIDVKVNDVSVTGVGVTSNTLLDIDESIIILLRNEIQRFEKKVHGVVKHSTLLDDETYLIGIELRVRLNPLDVSLLRMGLSKKAEDDDPRWM